MNRGKNYWNAEILLSKAASSEYEVRKLIHPYEADLIDLTIFVSCYNESSYIVKTLESICTVANEAGISFEIFVVDDNSTDNSKELVADFIKKHPKEIIVLRSNKENKGLAQNYFDIANLGRGKYFRLMCGDNGETIESTKKVFDFIGKADIIIPYYIKIEGKGAFRNYLSYSYTYLMNKISGNNLKYYNGLAVHLRQNVTRWNSYTRGFGFQAYLLCELISCGFTYAEVGLLAIERRIGDSNAITLANFLSVTNTLIQVGIRRLSNTFHSLKNN